MEVIAIVLAVLVVALAAALLVQLRGRGGIGPAVRGRPSRMRRRSVPGHDAMAAAVASHSEAIDPADVAVEELRLRAQANRVAAAAHEREARAESGLEADVHREAAIEHERTADELERRAANGDPRSPYADPQAPSTR
jgi:hypothetical protein